MNQAGVSYQDSIIVSKEHIDNLNHVNNVVYVQWINDISEKHWKTISTPDINSKYLWVVLKHEVDYLGEAVLGDELIIKTYVGESVGVKSIRYVEIYNNSKPIVKGKTTWCLIDLKSHKPKRIEIDILNILYAKS